MNYLYWNETTITDFAPNAISEMYEKGYVFTRIGKGVMQQTRSVRIDLAKFQLSSENRRIMKKTEGIILAKIELPLTEYDFSLGKLAKDFYDTKFGPGIMSAQKIKEMVNEPMKSNFNILLNFSLTESTENSQPKVIGYTICYSNDSIIHYSYPFYDLQSSFKDTGLGMMIRAIEDSKSHGLKYIYLGSLQRPSDTYKLQFEGLEWFDGATWQTDLEVVKKILTSAKIDE